MQAFLILMLLAGFGFLLAFIVAEFGQNKLLRQASSFLVRKSERPFHQNSGGRFPLKDLARFEKDLKNLRSVVVLASVVENPTTDLAKAVIDNFQEAVEYKFFVSKEHNSLASLTGYREWYKHAFELALGSATADPLDSHSRIKSAKFDDLLEIKILPTPWYNVPYVFYTYAPDSGAPQTVAFRGSEFGRGIAAFYHQISPAEANTIIDLCAASSVDFRDAMPPDGVQIAEVASSNILAFTKANTP